MSRRSVTQSASNSAARSSMDGPHATGATFHRIGPRPDTGVAVHRELQQGSKDDALISMVRMICPRPCEGGRFALRGANLNRRPILAFRRVSADSAHLHRPAYGAVDTIFTDVAVISITPAGLLLEEK